MELSLSFKVRGPISRALLSIALPKTARTLATRLRVQTDKLAERTAQMGRPTAPEHLVAQLSRAGFEYKGTTRTTLPVKAPMLGREPVGFVTFDRFEKMKDGRRVVQYLTNLGHEYMPVALGTYALGEGFRRHKFFDQHPEDTRVEIRDVAPDGKGRLKLDLAVDGALTWATSGRPKGGLVSFAVERRTPSNQELHLHFSPTVGEPVGLHTRRPLFG